MSRSFKFIKKNLLSKIKNIHIYIGFFGFHNEKCIRKEKLERDHAPCPKCVTVYLRSN